jgi:protein TonB
MAAPPAPPAASPPPEPKRVEPVHIGGQLTAPALLYRVEPIYPPLAASAQLGGVVILEALVDDDGCVKSVTVLRRVPLLTAAAVEAVKEWRYSPLVLNGAPTPFILTVTLNFRVAER